MTSLLEALPGAIEAAERRVRPHILRTPLTPAPWLHGQLWLKCEHLQHTGSFKLRGALNRLLSLTEAERDRGIIAASTGNHGQGVALAARVAGVAATVYVPEKAAPVKLEAMALLGADVETVSGDGLAAELAARAAADGSGRVFVSPYNDPVVVAGQGTIGLELAEQLPEVDTVLVSVGGGGLISGIGAALKTRRPEVRMIGCWPRNAPAMHACLEAGRIHPVSEQPTLSDGTAGGVEEDAVTFELCRSLIDQHVLVGEDQIASAMRLLAEKERWIVEGAAGVALAAALELGPETLGRCAVVLCGRNIDFTRFIEVTSAAA